MPDLPADEPITIDAIDVRLDLMYALADLFHVLHSEVPATVTDPLKRDASVFDRLWIEVAIAVSGAFGHYFKDAIEPDEFARAVVVTRKRGLPLDH
ncbi:MAG: hypothetical protein WCO96_08830 [Actinomycetes bacterium]